MSEHKTTKTALTHYLNSYGTIGKKPPWYDTIRAARYLGIPPWEMEAQPVWQERVLIALEAEADRSPD